MEIRKIMSLMVSISGIRGIVGDSLTPNIISRYTTGFAAYVRRYDAEAPLVVVGRDGRITGKPVADIITATLAMSGVRVCDIGICPTPTVQLAVEGLHASGGISVTASHNPMQWNGMKFMAPSGMFLDAAENAEFWALAASPARYAGWEEFGTVLADSSWIRKHIDAILTLHYIDVAKIRKRRFRVVLDCVNAAGGAIMPTLLRELGCDVIEMLCDVSGVFKHTPEPIPENLTELAKRVRDEHADVGVAVDPDVDRLVLINELGEPYGEEYTIATAIDFALRHRTPAPQVPTVVVNLSTTRAVDDITRKHGARLLRTPVGEINVARAMKSVGALIGGEGSGGVILPAVHLGRDAMVGTGLIFQALAEAGTTLSQLKSTLPQYAIAKGKITIKSGSPDRVLAILRERHTASGRINTDDGVRIDFDDYWVHFRKSNTEPIVRIIAEAHDMDRARRIVEQFTAEVAALEH
jgi:phosphomannomutase